MSRLRVSLLAFTLVLAACGAGVEPLEEQMNDGGTSGTDASTQALTVEVGTGQSEFEVISDGMMLDLIQAPQSGTGMLGTHFWISVRVTNMVVERANVRVKLVRVEDGMVVSDLTRDENFVQDSSGSTVIGFRAVVTQCADVNSKELEVVAEIEDFAAHKGSDTAMFRGPMFCPRVCEECG